ncbi:unnamed protein product [Staurois parvus]|uniref:Uncharacterized protein n=1 Tax=Staurois parvus TaxID=386267 RepID=A0ABN9CVZ5_9NEOB|nr:unnamed protein product [Staurois parvus]
MEGFSANGNLLEQLGLISSVLHDDQDSNPNTARSCDSHMADEFPEINGGSGSDTQNPDALEESESINSMGQSSPDLSDNEEEDRLRSEELTHGVTELPAEVSLSGSEPDESEDLAMEREDDREARDAYRSGYQSSSSHPESSQRDTSPSVQSVEELPDMEETSTLQHFNLLSDPIQLPNFFLPPQHLEASMRLLSQSSIPSSSAQQRDGETPIAKGIPFRRRTRQTPKINPDELPEKEAKRIARIFAAQFSNK